jgi:hypothetical protein
MFGKGCNHKFEEQTRKAISVNPNKVRNLKLDEADSKRIAELVLLGATVIVLKCSKCGEFKDQILVGNHE